MGHGYGTMIEGLLAVHLAGLKYSAWSNLDLSPTAIELRQNLLNGCDTVDTFGKTETM